MVRISEYVVDTLARLAAPADQWLHCQGCRRFFQYRRARRRRGSTRWSCPFCGVDAVEVELWDARREREDPRWPARPEALAHGQRSPEMMPFYDARAAREREELMALFAASPEWAALGLAGVPRWADELLVAAWGWGANADGVMVDVLAAGGLGSVFDTRRGAGPQHAPAIVAELEAWFTFAERALGHPYATECLAYVREPGQVDEVAAYLADELARGAAAEVPASRSAAAPTRGSAPPKPARRPARQRMGLRCVR